MWSKHTDTAFIRCIFRQCCIPILKKLFEVNDRHVRLILLKYFPLYVSMFDRDVLQSFILPEVSYLNNYDIFISSVFQLLFAINIQSIAYEEKTSHLHYLHQFSIVCITLHYLHHPAWSVSACFTRINFHHLELSASSPTLLASTSIACIVMYTQPYCDCLFQLRLGLQDSDDELVSATFSAMQYLVSLLGAHVIIGGERVQQFTERRPKVTLGLYWKSFINCCLKSEKNDWVIENIYGPN